MIAKEISFLKFMEGNQQCIIPIYQRTYSWEREQCEQLWQDIIHVAISDETSAHFVGSIVYIQDGLYHPADLSQFLVIDGQQRLTTLTLLLVALAKTYAEQGGEASIRRDQIYDFYLKNKYASGDDRYKLLLTQNDRASLIALIDDREMPNGASPNITKNFQYLIEQIRKSGIDLSTIYKGISKLIVVAIALDRAHDNPQLIFESLNSTGIDLSQADLIRNYVLMSLTPMEQIDLYERYWLPMETSFGHTYSLIFDRYMRDYLTVKSQSGAIPRIDLVYKSFKAYREHVVPDKSIADILEDMHQFARYFTRMAFPIEGNILDTRIRAALMDIATLEANVAYPFLLEVYDDFNHNLLSHDDFIAILRLVESYVFRRAICGLATNSMNKTFATIMRVIDKTHYLKSVEAAFLNLQTYKCFPSNEDFCEAFITKDVYNFYRRNYLLGKLENFNKKETAIIANYTIEHVLPQNEHLSEPWRKALGSEWQAVQKRYVHTIGNLTLTGYNSELSDKHFLEKRDMEGGFGQSPLSLNQGLGQLDHWDQSTIEQRGNHLAQRAIMIWPRPIMSKEEISTFVKQKYRAKGPTYTLSVHSEYLNGAILTLFDTLRQRIINIDSSVREEIKQLYIAYKTTTNFVDIVPQRARLRLSLNMKFSLIRDPRGICSDITNKGRWGNGDVEFGLMPGDDLEYALFLIQQSFELHRDDRDVDTIISLADASMSINQEEEQ